MYSFYEASRSKKFGRTSTNMYLQFKWDVENFANHRFNVKTAKSRIDDSAPLTFTHMFIKPKKMQLELERYSTIQRNNRLLLERLATIHREGAWIDNKNFCEIKSLNTWKRQQEMINLAYNNQIMLARLQDVKAIHNKSKLEDEYLMNQKRKAHIRKFPPNWREIQEQLNRLKAHTFKKVYKQRMRNYRKLPKLELHDNEIKKADKETCEAEKQEQTEKEKRTEAGKDHKKDREKNISATDKRKSTREEKKKQPQEANKEKFEENEAEKRAIYEKEMKKRQKQKQDIERWKKEKEEKRKKEIEEMEKQKKHEEILKQRRDRERIRIMEKVKAVKEKREAEEKEKKEQSTGRTSDHLKKDLLKSTKEKEKLGSNKQTNRKNIQAKPKYSNTSTGSSGHKFKDREDDDKEKLELGSSIADMTEDKKEKRKAEDAESDEVTSAGSVYSEEFDEDIISDSETPDQTTSDNQSQSSTDNKSDNEDNEN